MWRAELKVAVELAFVDHMLNHQVREHLFGNEFVVLLFIIQNIVIVIFWSSLHTERAAIKDSIDAAAQ
jgi:hypothetical protein